MADETRMVAAGVDVGTEYVKAIVVEEHGPVRGRAVIPTRGYFQACAYEALHSALEDAGVPKEALVGIGATGFGTGCVPDATHTATESACHAMGAFHHTGYAMTLVNIGGRQPEVIVVDETGRRVSSRGVRACAVGVGSFLMFAARHLDVSPTRFDELAAAANRPVPVSSYCSVFSSTGVLERLREGAQREEVAQGCLFSIAERVAEIGGFTAPIVVSGGVAEYFPGVLRALETLAERPVQALPDPIFTGALGAALLVFQPAAVTA
jgi:predicted CoA-substrate-specific enzyme activase